MPRKKSPRLRGKVVPELDHLPLSRIRTADAQGNCCWAPCLLLGDGTGLGPLCLRFFLSPSSKGDRTGANAAAAACSMR